MTAQEKAKELIDKFARIDGYQDSIDLSTCLDEIEYALIAVDEIIELLVDLSDGEFTYIHQVEYYDLVKKELLKMK
jgi:hypothetical protein